MNSVPPNALPVVDRNIPPALKELDQWAAWRWELRDGKWTKTPLNPATGHYARSNVPDTWGSFEAALGLMQRRWLPGIGFMFHLADGLAGVDLDHCRHPLTEEVEPWALKMVKELHSYTEVSPSQTGLKIFLRGKLPQGRRRKGNIEMYDRARFFTTTGHRLPQVPSNIQYRQEELSALHQRIFGELTSPHRDNTKKVRHTGTANRLSDTELIDRAVRAANGEKFRRLWAGDTSDYGTDGNEGRSEADLALCSLLAFWCGPDEARIDTLFRHSGLYRGKWERADYRALTLAAALDREEFWAGDGVAALRRGKAYARRREVVRLA